MKKVILVAIATLGLMSCEPAATKAEERAAEIAGFQTNINTIKDIKVANDVVTLEGLTLSKVATDEVEQAKRDAALETYNSRI